MVRYWTHLRDAHQLLRDLFLKIRLPCFRPELFVALSHRPPSNPSEFYASKLGLLCHSLSGGLSWTCKNKYAITQRREDCKPSPSIRIPSGEQSNMPPSSSISKAHFLLEARTQSTFQTFVRVTFRERLAGQETVRALVLKSMSRISFTSNMFVFEHMFINSTALRFGANSPCGSSDGVRHG